MIAWLGKRCTANEFAKLGVADRGEQAYEFFDEVFSDEIADMTAKERAAVFSAVERQLDRVADFLGIPQLREKLRSR